MIVFSESQYTGKFKTQIDDLLGVQIPLKEQLKKGFTGSSLYRLTDVYLKNERSDLTELNSRCNFQKYPDGLMLRINQSMNLYFIAISYSSINRIELIKGEEIICPALFSPMRVLLALGVSIRYARYFRFRIWEYSTELLTLKIFSGDDYLELDSSGWNYYKAQNYFKNLLNV